MNRQDLLSLINAHASKLSLPKGIDPRRLMYAFACAESALGVGADRSRFEPSYSGNHYTRLPRGTSMFEKSELVKTLFCLWGDCAAQSYGIFQIMYPTAVWLGELDSSTPPWKLAEPDTNIKAFIRMIGYITAKQEAHTLSEIADAYNSGNFKDKNIPLGYISKIESAYREAESAFAAFDKNKPSA